jgi:hypothetical protein
MSDITAWSVEPCGSEEKNLSSLINLEKYNHGESCFRHLNVVGWIRCGSKGQRSAAHG